MRTILKTGLLGILTLIVIVGCTTQNPAYTPIATGQPDTNTVPKYIANLDAINTWSNRAWVAQNATAPINPYSGITDKAINFGFGAAAMVAAVIAGFQSKKKNGLKSALVATISGVEQATKQPTITAESLKASIQSHAQAAGVQDTVLDPIVQKVT